MHLNTTDSLTLSKIAFKQGLAEGLAEGEAKGLAEGEAKGLAEGVVRIMLSMKKEADEICEQLVLICKMSPEQARRTLESLSNCN